MSKEEMYTVGYFYGAEGLTLSEYKAMVNQFISLWSNEIASEFIRGYHDHIQQIFNNN